MNNNQKQFLRRVHLDGHLGPNIENVGVKFNKEDFQKKLKESNVAAITLFAKCHHGFTYYPSKFAPMHPSLSFDLLGAQISAAHEIGVKTCIYITMGWSANDYKMHPEWASYSFETKQVRNHGYDFDEPKDEKIPNCCWVTLCPSGEYLQHLKDITREICEKYKPVDGIFYDICLDGDSCVCPNCVKAMKERGLNPENEQDAEKYFKIQRLEMMEELNAIIKEKNPDSTVFYNHTGVAGRGHIDFTNYHDYDTHFEIEELPTFAGTYDTSCYSIKKFSMYNKPILGMTGKFHLGWGEFGGYKKPEALVYEAANDLSMGIGICVGDQLNPNGELEAATYNIIGEAFGYYASLEDYCFPSKALNDIGLVPSKNYDINIAVSELLLKNQLDYDIIDEKSDLNKISLIIIPSDAQISEGLKLSLKEYEKQGKNLLIVGNAIKDYEVEGVKYIKQSKCDVHYVMNKEVCISPVLIHTPTHVVDYKKGDIIATIREPFFNRTYAHYCSHGFSPAKNEDATYPAALQINNVTYLANDIFVEHNEYGQVYVNDYFKMILRRVYSDRMLAVDGLMSSGRVRLRENENKKLYNLHLLYAPILKYGMAYIIDDIPTLHDVKVSLRLKKKIKKVVLLPQNQEIQFVENNGRVEFNIEKMRLHQLINLEY